MNDSIEQLTNELDNNIRDMKFPEKPFLKKRLTALVKQECIAFAFDCIAAKRRIGNAAELRKSIEELYNQNHKPCKQTER